MFIVDVDLDNDRYSDGLRVNHSLGISPYFGFVSANNKVSEIKEDAFSFLKMGHQRILKGESKLFGSTVVIIEPDEHDDWGFVDGDDDNTPAEEVESN